MSDKNKKYIQVSLGLVVIIVIIIIGVWYGGPKETSQQGNVVADKTDDKTTGTPTGSTDVQVVDNVNNANTVSRVLASSTYTSGKPFVVRIKTFPQNSTIVQVVADSIKNTDGSNPLYTISAISDGGSVNNGAIQWGPIFDNKAHNLTYTVTFPINASGTKTFKGSANFDNLPTQSIGGDSIVNSDSSTTAK